VSYPSENAPLESHQIAQMTWTKDPTTGRMVKLRHTSELEFDYRVWLQSDCSHSEYAIRKVKPNNASWMYRNQCVNCGRANGQWIKKSLIPNADAILEAPLDQLPEYEKQRYFELEKIGQKHLEMKSDKGNAEYASYLRSPAWKAKREKVLTRANGHCEGCGENTATQVHHLTYQNIYKEFLWELVAICDDCHDRVHQDLPEEGENANVMLDDDAFECEDEEWLE
jgi:5-methylcytosine-specific restriction endonuclease McrA